MGTDNRFVPKNIRTGVEYPPISADEKAYYEKDVLLKGKYTFLPVVSEIHSPVSPPIEAVPPIAELDKAQKSKKSTKKV